jgi:hypothetical protein
MCDTLEVFDHCGEGMRLLQVAEALSNKNYEAPEIAQLRERFDLMKNNRAYLVGKDAQWMREFGLFAKASCPDYPTFALLIRFGNALNPMVANKAEREWLVEFLDHWGGGLVRTATAQSGQCG